jgi:trimeric autotransporter adhesin
VSNLQGVTYEWKMDEYPGFGLTEGKQIGLIAQDVEKVLPELVSEDKDGYKAVSYTKLTAVLVEAVKELKAENEQHLTRLKKQQAEIEELRSMIKELKS